MEYPLSVKSYKISDKMILKLMIKLDDQNFKKILPFVENILIFSI